MSDVTIARRRLAALEEVEEILEREWGETAHGILAMYMDRASVDVREYVEEGEGTEPGYWLNVVGVYKAVKELRQTMEGMTRHAESFAVEHGPEPIWTEDNFAPEPRL